MNFVYFFVVDFVFVSDGFFDVEGLLMDVLFLIEGFGLREVFFFWVICLFWFFMFNVLRVVCFILVKKYDNFEKKIMIDKID